MIIPTYSQFRTNFALPAAPIEKDGFPRWPVNKVRETGSGFGDAGSTIINIPKPPRDYAPLYVSCNSFQPDAVPFLSEYRWYSSARSQTPASEAVVASTPDLRFVSGAASGYGILDTVNGGKNWEQKTDPQASTFFSVSRPTVSDVWAVGADGVIAYSATSGQTWASQASGITTALSSSHFIDSATGWAAGADAVVLTTTNGGALWTPLVTAPATFYIFDISFANANVGVACGEQGKTIHTIDGGATWLSVNVPTATNLEAIDMLPGWPGTAWMISGAGAVYKTIDGGASYVQQYVTANGLSSVSAVSHSVAYIAGVDGFVAKTVDGGASWSQLTVSADSQFSDIKFVSPTIGWVATIDGKIFFTSDGGASWVPQQTFTDSAIFSLDSPSVNMGLLTFSGTIQLSVNTTLPESTIMTPESVSETFKNCHLYVQRMSDQTIQWVDLLRAMVANTG